MDLFPVSRAARSPQTVLFFPKKKVYVFIIYVFLFFGCGESSQLQ